jgi:hypothetical protein
MADNKLLSQMLERLVNEDQSGAEELFHEYVVAKSREIYEELIESEIADEEVDEAADDEEAEEDKVDEAADEDKDDEDQMDENFEDIAIEADDEMGGDATDDLEADLDADSDMDSDEGEESEEEIMQDLGDIIDELQAKFDALTGEEEEQGEFGDDDMGDDEGNPFAKQEDFELETVREYVEKVAPAKMGDNGANAKSTVAGKNDMGGTAANILSGKNGQDGGEVGAGSKIKGSALNDQNPKEDNAGNINVPGGKAGNAFSKKEPGHGAEKKGAGENAENKQSLFRGRR